MKNLKTKKVGKKTKNLYPKNWLSVFFAFICYVGFFDWEHTLYVDIARETQLLSFFQI